MQVAQVSCGNTKALYSKFSNWMNSNAKVDELKLRYAQITEKPQTGIEDVTELDNIISQYNTLSRYNSQNFSIMEGKDSSNENDYNEQINKIAQGDFELYDLNKDDVVELSEYIAKEIADMEEVDKENEQKIKGYSTLLFSLMDEGMGNSDKNGTLSAEEFASLYKNMDQFDITQENPMTGIYDGILNFDSCANMPAYLIENLFSEETIQQAIDMWNE